MASTMKLTAYATADQFLKMTRDWLVREEAANNLMLGIALRLKQSPTPCYLATVSEGKDLVLAALLTPPFPVMLNSPREAPDEALELLAHHLLEAGAPIPRTAESAAKPIAKASPARRKKLRRGSSLSKGNFFCFWSDMEGTWFENGGKTIGYRIRGEGYRGRRSGK